MNNVESLDVVKERELIRQIKKELESFGDTYNWVSTDFSKVTEHASIKSQLGKANIETRNAFINKHGRVHCLNVVSNVIQLFKLIHFDDLESDYLSLNLGILNTKEELLFSLIVSAYIHDVGRFYDPEIGKHPPNISLAIDKLSGMLHNDEICRVGNIKSSHGDILERIKELCLCHDNKYLPSNIVEIAIIKIADALDCDCSRVFPENEIPELQSIDDEFSKLKRIILKDDHPEDRFSCEKIHCVTSSYQSDEGVVDVIVNATDIRGSVKPVKTLIKCLQLCRQGGSDSTKELASRIRVFLHIEGSDVLPQNLYLLFPENTRDIKRTVQTEISKAKLELFIIDMEGRTELINYTSHIVKSKKGIQSMPTWLEGYKRADWHSQLEVQAFIRINGDWKEVTTVHKYSERQGLAHWWKISFKEKGSEDQISFKEGDLVEIKEIVKWPGCTNVPSDEFYYRPAHPCKHMEITVYFPSNLDKKNINSWLEIRNGPEIICKNPTKLKLEFDKCRKALRAKGTFSNLAPNYDYSLKWLVK